MRSWTENSAAVARDDALVEALSSRRRLPAPLAHDEVARYLAEWAAAVDAGLPAPATEGRRVTVAGQDRPTTSRRRLGHLLGPRLGRGSSGPPDRPTAARRPSRVVRRAAVTAAILVLASFGGVSAAERAQPGGALWSLSRLVDPARATSLEAHQLALMALERAEQAAQQGHYKEAKQQFEAAMGSLRQVRPQDGYGALAAGLTVLARKLHMRAPTPAGGSSPPLATPSASEVPSSTSTPPPTSTPSPSGTRSPTSTPSPSGTPPPTSTPSPTGSSQEPAPPSVTSPVETGGAPSNPSAGVMGSSVPPVSTSAALPGPPVAVGD